MERQGLGLLSDTRCYAMNLGQIDQIDHDLDHVRDQIDHDLDHRDRNPPM